MRDMTVYRDLVRLHEEVRIGVLKQIPTQYRISDSLTIESCFDGLRDCISFLSRNRDNKKKADKIDDSMRFIDALYYKIELQSLAHYINQNKAVDIFLKIQQIEKQLAGLRKHLVSDQNSNTQGSGSESVLK